VGFLCLSASCFCCWQLITKQLIFKQLITKQLIIKQLIIKLIISLPTSRRSMTDN